MDFKSFITHYLGFGNFIYRDKSGKQIDIAKSLKDFEARITIADLNISDKVRVLDKMEEIVAVVTPPRSEAEMEELNKEVEENAGEVKTEGDEKKAAKEAEVAAEGTPEGDKKEAKKEEKK